jgi:uncharacterized membrane protein
MKVLFLMPMLLIIASNVIYHLAQKTIPHEVNPAFSLLVSYAVAIVLTLLMIPFFDRPVTYSSEALRAFNISTVFVGVSAVGVELGWLLIYRTGWQINTTALISSSALAIILLLIGTIFFNEAFSEKKLLGVILCLIGLFLLNSK